MAEERSMTDLCKEALIKIAESDEPLTFIQNAKEAANKEAKKKWVGTAVSDNTYGKKLPFAKSHHDVTDDVPAYKGWKIVQHNLMRHYVLLDRDGLVRAQHWEPSYGRPFFKLFLEVLISLADKYPRKTKKKDIYQLVTDEKIEIKENCVGLTVTEARVKYPHSINLASGFFTEHPKDGQALVPVRNFFTNIASSKDDECKSLLGKMGAKSVEIITIDESKKTNTTELKGGNDKFNANAEMSVSNDMRDSSIQRVEFEVRSSDIPPDLLENSVWFKNDSRMKKILEMRLETNILKDYYIDTTIEEDYEFDFSAAAKVLGVAEVSLRNEYEKESKQYRKFHVIFG